MAIKLSEFTLAEPGIHQAVCCEVTIVIIEEVDRRSGQSVQSEKAIFSFELVDQVDGQGNRVIIEKDFYASITAQNAFGTFLKGWDGSGAKLGKQRLEEWVNAMNSGKVAGKNGMITVTHKISARGNTYAIIEAIAQPMTGMTAAEVSPKYIPYGIRQANREAAKGARGQGSGGNASQADPPKKSNDIPF